MSRLSQGGMNVKKVNPKVLISQYFRDPLNVESVIHFDEFNRDVCIERTAFEEIELFSNLNKSYSPSKEEIHRATSETTKSLRAAVNNLFVDVLSHVEDRTNALTSFHMLLFKRLQIITRIQEYMGINLQRQEKRRNGFSVLPKVQLKYMNATQLEVQKALEKDMTKKDDKKGLFGKLKTTRYRALYRTISKNMTPLCMKNVDLRKFHDHVLTYASERKNKKSAREKSLKSLLLLSIATGNLLEFLEVLCLILSFGNTSNTLCSSSKPDKGIKIKMDDAKALHDWLLVVSDKGSDSMLRELLNNDDRYKVKYSAKVTPESYVWSCEQLFTVVLGGIEQAVAKDSKGKRLEDGLCGLWKEYSLQPCGKVFSYLTFLLEKFAFDQQVHDSPESPTRANNAKIVCALLRILHHNVRLMSAYQKPGEGVGAMSKRLGEGESNNAPPAWVGKTQSMLYSLLKQMHKFASDETMSFMVANECTSAIVDGMTLFFPTMADQRKYLMDILALQQKSLLDLMIMDKLLLRLVRDPLFFDAFCGGNLLRPGAFSASCQTFVTPLVQRLLDLVRDYVLEQTTGTSTDSKTKGEGIRRSFVGNALDFVLLLMHSLSARVTPSYTKFQQPTNSVAFNAPEGTLFLSLSKLILESALSSLGAFPGRFKRQEAEMVYRLMKECSVVKVVYPLLQMFIRLLWKNDKRVKYNLYCLTSFLFPYLLQLLECVSKINKFLKNKDQLFEYSVAETDHPYMGNLNEKINIKFSEEHTFSSAIVFHPRCRTAQSTDTLIISATPKSKMNGKKVQPLKFSGVGNTIPVNPLITSGNEVQLTFTSNEQQTDWGMRCSILPTLKLNWMFEFEKYIGWLGGRLSTYVMSAFPYTDDEKANFEWLNSRLFFQGLQESFDSLQPVEQVKETFISEILGKKKKKKTPGTNAQKLIDYMAHRLRMESMMLRNNVDVITAERSVIACLIKHCGEIGTAISFAKIVQENEDDFPALFNKVPQSLIQIWRTARPIRTWMMQKKQKEETEHRLIRDKVIKMSKFLLKLKPASMMNSEMEELMEVVGLKKKVKEEEEKGEGSDTPAGVSEVKQQFLSAKLRMRKTDESVIDNIKGLGETILKFVQSEIEVSQFKKLLKMRKDRACCRQKSFDMYTSFLGRTRYDSVKAEITREMFSILTSGNFKKGDSIDFHYFNNIESCGTEFYEKVSSSFHQFIKKLFGGSSSKGSKRMTRFNDDKTIRSGFVRCVLMTCLISFKPGDIKWVLEQDLLTKLLPLLYGGAVDESDIKFKQKSSMEMEKVYLNKLGWKTFRLLAVRCVEILEEWEAGEKFKVGLKKRRKVKTNLDILRDKIFEVLFDEFEKMMAKKSVISSVVEEMLNLMVSLVNTSSASGCLSSSRFQKLVIPLLNLNFPKIQQLSLKLYGQLVLSEETSEGVSDESSMAFKCKFVNTLFSLLGTYEMGKIFGKDIFSDQQGGVTIGLQLAKEIFVLIRKLLQPDTPKEWKKPIIILLEQYLMESDSLLKRILESKVKFVNLDKRDKKKVKIILAAFVLIYGLNYIPDIDEYVRVKLHGRWEDAKIVFVEESKHQSKIVLKESCGIDRVQRVQSEYVHVLTNEIIEPEVFTLNQKVLISLNSMITTYGNLLFSPKANDLCQHFHLMYSSLWNKSLSLLHEMINEKVFQIQNLKILPDLIYFAKQTTPIKYGEELKLCTCSYTFSGKNVIPQIMFHCHTCKLVNDKAVCLFCVKTCHRGHAFAQCKREDLYCACGSGENKNGKCISIQTPPSDPKLSIKRMESLALRVASFLPMVAQQDDDQSASFISVGAKSQSRFIAPSNFVNPSSSTGYLINSHTREISFRSEYARSFSMIGTDYPIPPNYIGFYYEITIVSLGGKRGGISLGFSQIVNRNLAWPGILKGSFTLHVRVGKVFMGEQYFQSVKEIGKVKRGDVFGCGWDKSTQEIYFTKNGKRLKIKIPGVSASFSLYPIIMIKNGNNGAVIPNLGNKKYRYNVGKSKKKIGVDGGSLTFSKLSSKENMARKIVDLRSLGFQENNCKQALQKYSDLNSAAAYLHRRGMRPMRYQLSDSLVQMGFDRPLAIKALELSGDDVNLALNWLLQEHHTVQHNRNKHAKQIYPDRGIPFLGSNIDRQKVHDEVMKGLLVSHLTKINENNFTNIRKKNPEMGSLVVINPYLKEDDKSTSNCQKMMGMNGVIIRRLEQGAYVQTIDQRNGAFLSAFVSFNDLIAPTSEFEHLKLSDICNEVVSFGKRIGTMYCRKIVQYYLSHVSEIDLMNSYRTPECMYESMKVIFVKQLHLQYPNFQANTIDVNPSISRMCKNLEDVSIIDDGKEEEFFNFIAGEALKEISLFQEGMPFHRKVLYKNAYNNKRIQIRFWGASSIFVSFNNKCVLPSNYDYLTFYFGESGREMKSFRGPQNQSKTKIPRYVVIPGDRFWFEFRTSKIVEGSGFEFHVSPSTFRFDERQALSQPNIGLAGLVLQNTTNTFWRKNIEQTKKTFEISINYLMAPFAPFKGLVCNAMESLMMELFNKKTFRPNLNIIKAFRIELEDLYISFKKRSEASDLPLPIYHSLVELMAIFRSYVANDLCRSVFPYQDCSQHMYCFKGQGRNQKQDVVTCTACAMNSSLLGDQIPQYHSHSFTKCGVNFGKNFEWGNEKSRKSNTNLMPYRQLKSHVGDWFEHTSWIDQLTIVRSLLEMFVKSDSSAEALNFPKWVLFDMAVEMSKQKEFRESRHPYLDLNGEGEIFLKDSQVMYITFDKHTHTEKHDTICFSRRRLGDSDLGKLSGDKLGDKRYKIFTNRIFYQFRCDGGDHKMNCKNCKRNIFGVRFHCCSSECDDYELCQNCIQRSRVHNQEHIFLKVRRPMDWQPASLPELYTRRWRNTSTYRKNVHKGYKCEHCGKDPIVGVRFWCENCPNYNLCGKCGEFEFKFHNRLHVFLRIVRPLPSSKKKLPPNHLPYGLIYDKDLYWGFLFKVENEQKFGPNDPQIKKLMKDIKKKINESNWTYEKDAELVHYIETYCKSWQSLKWNELNPTSDELFNYPMLSATDLLAMRYRFMLLKLFNNKIDRVLNMVNLEAADFRQQRSYSNISTLIALTRKRIFYSIKRDVWDNTLTKTVVDVKTAIDLTLNRQLAADAKSSPNKIHSAFNSLYIQTYNQVQAIHPRVLSRKKGAWKVTFVGEQADDYGGPFRESLSQMCNELQSDQLDLFLTVPNQQHGVGENREKFIPNPRARSYLHMKWYNFVGVLMGVGMLSKNELPLDLPSIFWKRLVKERVDVKDLLAIDQMCYKSMEDLRNIHLKGVSRDDFEYVIVDQYFTTVGSDGMEVELCKGGRKKPVTFDNRFEYADMVEDFRVKEMQRQVHAIREGLFSLVPSRYTPIFSWKELEKIICGESTIDIDILKKHSVYEEYKETDRGIKYFWRVFKSFNSHERSLYLRFVWGRSRLPVTEEGWTHPHKIQKLERSSPDKVLPLSHTCFFSIELPNYSSEKLMREKLLYAITNCRAIDTDVTRNARSARNMQ